jgi:hypothetical protein
MSANVDRKLIPFPAMMENDVFPFAEDARGIRRSAAIFHHPFVRIAFCYLHLDSPRGRRLLSMGIDGK